MGELEKEVGQTKRSKGRDDIRGNFIKMEKDHKRWGAA